MSYKGFSVNKGQIWLIYVGANKKILPNYTLGMNKGVWGFEKLPKDRGHFDAIAVGDTVLFAHSMYWPDNQGDRPGWFPKFCTNANEFKCNLREVVEVIVTKSGYESNSPLWEDKLYGYRFDFTIKKHFQHIEIRPESFDVGYANAIMLSIGAGGKIVPLNAPLKVKVGKAKVSIISNPIDDNLSGKEGKEYYQTHKKRERNSKLVRQKKDKVFTENGDLFCEVCNFSFYETYGDRGEQFAECHHKNPLADLNGDETETELSDLAILCANCHRMVHRTRPWVDINTLKDIYEEQRNK